VRRQAAPSDLEDDFKVPVAGPRAACVSLVDILQPCWIYEGADMPTPWASPSASASCRFNFQIGADPRQIVLHPPRAPDGELEVRLDSCRRRAAGQHLPLAPATASTGRDHALAAPLPRPRISAAHDLCFTFTAKHLDPMWAIDWSSSSPFEPTACPAGSSRRA